MGFTLPLHHHRLAPRVGAEASDLGPFHLLTVLETGLELRL